MKKTGRDLYLSALKFVLCILPIALIGGFFTGVYLCEHSDGVTRALYISQAGSYEMFLMITTVQSVVYAMFTGFIGYLLANSTGLLKSFRFEKKTFIRTGVIIIILGILFACDSFTFGRWIPQVAADLEKGISISYFICSLTYGGVIEEVLLRWFLMSLIAWLIGKIVIRGKGDKNIPDYVFIIANFVAAFLFAAGHLPASIALFGKLTPLIVFRCFLLNGGFGLVFGRFYRKYGIQYAMLGHFGVHFVSKIILMVVL